MQRTRSILLPFPKGTDFLTQIANKSQALGFYSSYPFWEDRMSVLSYIPFGAEGIIVRVEADIRRGIPGTDITGLAEGAVREARERVRAAYRNSGLRYPEDRVLVNLAPAGIRKEGAALDLPIAISILAASGAVPKIEGLMALGELELSGRIRPVRGALAAVAAGDAVGIKGYIVPLDNRVEALSLAPDRVAAVGSLAEAVHVLEHWSRDGCFPVSEEDDAMAEAETGAGFIQRESEAAGAFGSKYIVKDDFRDYHGQYRYKRALEIAAAGGHNLLVFGPPGSGKTALARLFPSLLPELSPEEAVQTTKLHSLAGTLGLSVGLIRRPPFRSPHHSASVEGILGGGRVPRPGEISLAHNGVLFLDEAAEFRADILRALREPLEDRLITIARAEGSIRFPADFQLILAVNPCPCGRLGLTRGACLCSAEEVARHWRRLGAALLDRVELRVPLRPEPISRSSSEEESGADIAKRVAKAIRRQEERYRGLFVRRNAGLTPALLETFCPLDRQGTSVMDETVSRLGLSRRARGAVLKVALTIADLADDKRLRTDYILEALQHRRYGDDPYDIIAASEEGL